MTLTVVLPAHAELLGEPQPLSLALPDGGLLLTGLSGVVLPGPQTLLRDSSGCCRISLYTSLGPPLPGLREGYRQPEGDNAFEREHGFETREISYGGLIRAHFKFGPLDQLFLGQSSGREPGAKTPLLGCECGEWGCWPLLARVVASDSTVVWNDFEQPFRKERDYRAFGPFQFDRRDYERAVTQLNELPV